MSIDLSAYLPYLAPAFGIVVAIGTLIFTALSLLQKADMSYVEQLKGRIKILEDERDTWDDERRALHAEIAQLSALLLQSTLLIRGDVAANTEVSKAAFHEANGAKILMAQAMEAVAKQTEASDKRLAHLEASASTVAETLKSSTDAAGAITQAAIDAAQRLEQKAADVAAALRKQPKTPPKA